MTNEFMFQLDLINVDTKLTKSISNFVSEKQNSFMNGLLNHVQTKIDELKKKNSSLTDKKYYSSLIDGIKGFYNKLFMQVTCNIQKTKDCVKIIYDDPTKLHEYNINHDISTMFVTLIGGGGAGGIGYINNNSMYVSGGGGGGGACITQKAIRISKGSKLEIKVGRGGSYNSLSANGETTCLKIIYPSGASTLLSCEGGKAGHPSLAYERKFVGGNGGKCIENSPSRIYKSDLFEIIIGNNPHVCITNDLNCIDVNDLFFSSANGENGLNGGISFPCQQIINGGDGGSSLFSSGGKGGHVNINLIDDSLQIDKQSLIGHNGSLGSGGGGSVPLSIIDPSVQCSGNGGHGCVFIHFE